MLSVEGPHVKLVQMIDVNRPPKFTLHTVIAFEVLQIVNSVEEFFLKYGIEHTNFL